MFLISSSSAMSRKRTYKQYLGNPWIGVPRETKRRYKQLDQVSSLSCLSTIFIQHDRQLKIKQINKPLHVGCNVFTQYGAVHKVCMLEGGDQSVWYTYRGGGWTHTQIRNR